MALTKRLRYEILRRDNHACHYCGASAPDAKLTVDHVMPTALGGGDEPSNLVTACADCNAGKSSSSPDEPIVESVSREAFMLAEAIKESMSEHLENQDVIDFEVAEWGEMWDRWQVIETGEAVYRPDEWEFTIETFLGLGFPLHELMRIGERALKKKDTKGHDGEWRYFCGTVWGIYKNVQKKALERVAERKTDLLVDAYYEGILD